MHTIENKIKAFTESHYIIQDVNFPIDEFLIRVGRYYPYLDYVFSPYNFWFYITAFNPNGAKSDDASNRTNSSKLFSDLQSLSDKIYQGVSMDKRGGWKEQGYFVVTDLYEKMKVIGRKYGQLALVQSSPGEKVTLLIL